MEWEDGPLLKSAGKRIPVLLDRIDEAKAQVNERVYPILEKNSSVGCASFLVQEKGESIEY
jgi:midasin (ATPase involved in ribosome maturation)